MQHISFKREVQGCVTTKRLRMGEDRRGEERKEHLRRIKRPSESSRVKILVIIVLIS